MDSQLLRREDSKTIFRRLADVDCRSVTDTRVGTSSTGTETVKADYYKMHLHLYMELLIDLPLIIYTK